MSGGSRVNGFLVLEDGTVFGGESCSACGFAFGEAVFTTAMTGYQEVVTDPSYSGQIVCFTAPMVGNYGVSAGRGFRSRSTNSWLLGKTLKGKVLATVADGRVVYEG